MTKNHEYNTPDKGAEDWHKPLNENFEQLDTDVIIKGAYSDRPENPPADTWFLATDRRIIFYYKDGSWDPVAGVGTEDSPIPGTANFTELNADSVRADQIETQDISVGNIGAVATTNYQQEFGAQEIIEFNEVIFDQGDQFDTSNHKFNPKSGGVYLVQVQATVFEMKTGDRLRLSIVAGDPAGQVRESAVSSYQNIQMLQIVQANAGESIYAQIDGSFSETRYVDSGAQFSVIQLG